MTKIPEPWVCNICGAQKKETNRWWIMFGSTILDFTRKPEETQLLSKDGNMLVLYEWSDIRAGLPDAIHLCGEECASHAQSQFMRGQWPPLPRGTFPPVKSSSSQEVKS